MRGNILKQNKTKQTIKSNQMSKLKKEELSRAQELTSRYNESVQQIGLLHVAQQDVMANVSAMKLEIV